MLDSITSPTLWWLTIAAVVALLAVDFVATRKPHEVSMREAVAWSAFAVPTVLQQRVLLSAIVGALVLRGIFIAAGGVALERFDWCLSRLRRSAAADRRRAAARRPGGTRP